MYNLLCFGDSNTYGYIPGGLGRYDETTRYTGVLKKLLGPNWNLFENGVVGRTCIFDQKSKPGRCGMDDIKKAVDESLPDVIVIMLGTNDVKSQFGANEQELSENMINLAKKAKEYAEANGKTPKMIIVAPAHITSDVLKITDDYNENSFQVSLTLPNAYRRAARNNGFIFFNAGDYVSVSSQDGEHLTEDGHRLLACALSKLIISCMS